MLDQFGNDVGPGFVGGSGQQMTQPTWGSYDNSAQVNSSAYDPQQLASIRQFAQGNWSDPGAMASAMTKYGVDANMLSAATAGMNGLTNNDIQNYVARIGSQTGNGTGFGGNTSNLQSMYGGFGAGPTAPATTNTSTTAPAGGGAPQQISAANFGFGSMSGQNPYLDQMAQSMGNQLTQNYQRNVAPSISSQAMAAGGYGGSRQGVLEANALNDMQNQYASGLANLYGNSYGQSLNYNLGLGGLANQAQSNANSYNLGMNNNALGYANLDANINQNNVQNQLAGAQFGLGLYGQDQQNAQTGINAGTTLQNTPMGYYNNFSNSANGLARGGGTSSSSSYAPGNAGTGALAGYQLYNAWNNGNRSVTSNMTGNYPGGPSWGTDLGSR